MTDKVFLNLTYVAGWIEVGICLVFTFTGSSSFYGPLWALLAGVSFATYLIAKDRTHRQNRGLQ